MVSVITRSSIIAASIACLAACGDHAVPLEPLTSFDGGVDSGVPDAGSPDGSVAPPPGCHLSVMPSSLDFGQVAPGTVVSQQIVIASDGSEDCVVQDLALTPDTDAAFTLSSGRVASQVVASGTSLIVSVEFAPTQAGCFGGLLAYPAGKVNIALGAQLIPVTGIGYIAPSSSCVGLPWMECMGGIGTSNGQFCANGKRKFVFVNDCQRAITIESEVVALPDAGFSVISGWVPQTVNPGDTSAPFEMGMACNAEPDGYCEATLEIQTDFQADPFEIFLGERSSVPGSQTDTFTGDSLLRSSQLPLSGTPDPSSFNVTLDGNALSATDWSYNALANTLILASPVTLQASDVVNVTYWLVCD